MKSNLANETFAVIAVYHARVKVQRGELQHFSLEHVVLMHVLCMSSV